MIKLKNLIYVICFTFFSFSSFSFEKSSNFSLNKFDKLNNQGKTIVINSWNEWCSVCATQTSIFEQAKKSGINSNSISFFILYLFYTY